MSAQADPTLGDLIGLIYDASFDRESWTAVVDKLRIVMDCPLSAIFFRDHLANGDRFEMIGTSGYASSALNDYASHFVSVDIRAPFVSRLRDNEIYTDDKRLDFATVKKSEIYNDFFRPADGGHAIGANLFAEPQRFCLISAHRSIKGGQFTDEQVAQFGRVIPHVSRALQLHRQVSGLTTLADGLAVAVHHFPMAVFLVRGDARVVFFNEAAEDLLKRPACPLQVIGSRLTVTTSDMAAVLKNDLRRAVDIGAGDTSAPPSIRRIPSSHAAEHGLGLMVVPVRRPEFVGAISREPLALVFASDAARYPNTAKDALMSQFGLSTAEAAVAAGLLDGLGVNAIADRRGVSRETVRVQLRSILAKTQTVTQGQLIGLAARSLAFLRRRAPPA